MIDWMYSILFLKKVTVGLLLLLVCISTSNASEQLDEARYLKKTFLEKNRFFSELPVSLKGEARGVRRSIRTRFSTHAEPSLAGSVTVESLRGGMRFKLASVDDLFYFDKNLRINATITVTSGELQVFSPVNLDFWQMAKLFIDTPEQRRFEGEDFVLEGFTQYVIKPGESVTISPALISIGGDYFLLIAASDKEVDNIHIVMK
jgi:hypothetical protein